MSQIRKQISNEKKIVLYCSKGYLSDWEVKEIEDIFSAWINWNEVLYQAVTHRTLCLLYYHIKRLGLVTKVENEILRYMKNEYILNLYKNETFINELKMVCEILENNQIKYSVLKGGILSSVVYPSIETRTFNDLDILIAYKDGTKVAKVLESLGYTQGEYDSETNTVIRFNRKQNLYHQINTHEFAPFNKATDNLLYPNIQVDFNHDIFWKGNCPYNVDVDELLNRSMQVNINGSNIRTLSIDDFIIQLCAHLYREATMIITIRRLKDLQLFKFADVLMFIEYYLDEINWTQFISRCKQMECSEIVYFVFYYINILYEDGIPAYVLNELEPEEKEYLNIFGVENETKQKWNMDFIDRIFETKRVLEVGDYQIEANDNYLKYMDRLS